jgi:hypothetical protein
MGSPSYAVALAEAFLAGPWDEEGLVARAAAGLGRRPRWLRPLARRVLAHFPGPQLPLQLNLAAFLFEIAGPAVESAYRLVIRRPPPMAPAACASSWRVPSLRTPGELAEWLDIPHGQLDWLADVQGRERRRAAGPLANYHYRWVAKRGGSARLIEVLKPRLKAVQRRIHREILDAIPPHAAAHGFRRERNVLSFAAPHVGQRVVLRLDLRDFFASITGARVAKLFATAGYPERVTRLLAGLCTNTPSADVWEQPPERLPRAERRRIERLVERPHLPQGAPTSPALANLCAYRLDRRLTGLARAAGAADTRYADDLAFSGDERLARSSRRFAVHAAVIATEEGFDVNHRKTRVMRQAVRQRIAGVVVNAHRNIDRSEFDRLRAVLFNCARYGPASQDREPRGDFRAHLAGRIAWVALLNPRRGQRLRALFDRISWAAGGDES